MVVTEHFLRTNAKALRLVVVFHGMLSSPKDFAQIDNYILRKIPDADLFIPLMPYSSYFSTARMVAIGQRAAQHIDRIVSEKAREGGQGYEDIVIVGHSMGGLLARYVLVHCWNCDQTERPKETSTARYAWSAQIS